MYVFITFAQEARLEGERGSRVVGLKFKEKEQKDLKNQGS